MINPTKAVLAAAIVCFGFGGTAPVFADGRHGPARFGVHKRAPVIVHGHRGGARFGLFLGIPLVLSSAYWGPRYYHPSPYYSPYYPPLVAAPVAPPTYIEQIPGAPTPSDAATTAPQPGYWYYCGDSQAYYPYVRECPGGWQRVAPQPPG